MIKIFLAGAPIEGTIANRTREIRETLLAIVPNRRKLNWGSLRTIGYPKRVKNTWRRWPVAARPPMIAMLLADQWHRP